jgi:hypothetical protein
MWGGGGKQNIVQIKMVSSYGKKIWLTFVLVLLVGE